MKKAFKRGLIQVTQNIDSFIITNGANSGLTLLILNQFKKKSVIFCKEILQLIEIKFFKLF